MLDQREQNHCDFSDVESRMKSHEERGILKDSIRQLLASNGCLESRVKATWSTIKGLSGICDIHPIGH